MRHRLLYLTFLTAFSLPAITKAQSIDCTSLYWSSQTHYEVGTAPYVASPPEYKPVFINYIGRNGATHLQKDVAATYTYRTLQKADSAHALTGEGKRLLTMMQLIKSIESGNADKLTQTGMEEMQSIGTRMLVNYKSIFDKSCVTVSAVKEDRMTQSAEALLAGLNRKLDAPGCDKINYNDDDNLRPVTVSKSLKEVTDKGDWKDNGETIRDKKGTKFNERFLGRFFNKTFLEDVDDATQDKFVTDMFNISLVTNSITAELTKAGHSYADVNLRSFFTCNEIELYSNANSAENFYRSGPGDDVQGIQVRSAIPLLMNLMNSTDAYSLSTTVAADLRITSADVIASLAALMNIKGANKASADATKFDRVWNAAEVIPWAANIQWILYQGTTPDTRTTYRIKFLLNEKEVEIDGLKSGDFPYYKWDDVKTLYKKKLNEDFDVENMSINTHNYLLNMKQ